MASFTIPELIIPGGLFVPDEYNYFSIESGGLPNGEDCLVVHGDVSQNYKAFQKAPVLSPDLMNSKSAVGWAMSFWLKLGNLTHASAGYQSNHHLIGVMGRTAANPANGAGTGLMSVTPSWSSPTTDSISTNHLWGLVSHSNSAGNPVCRVGFINQTHYRNAGLSGGQSNNWSTALTVDTWQQIIINFPVPAYTTPAGYLNTTAVTGAHSSGGFASLPVITDPMYFCIGSYSDTTEMNGRGGEWRIGKLAFHDTLLTLTDASMLYNAMTT